jgi:DNA-binding LacI/PurR family transcriptional regulator
MNNIRRLGAAGTRRPPSTGARLTMSDLAALAGVSKITVSRALRGSPLVTADTRRRVAEIAKQHGYRLNLPARNLRLNRSYTVAVVVDMDPSRDRPMSAPYLLDILGGISRELTAAGYSLVLTTVDALDGMALQSADGIVLLGQGAGDSAVRKLENALVPWVVWGAPHEGADYTIVGSDNRQGGALAAERFLSLGRRRLVFIGDTHHAEIAAREAGFQAALQAGGAELVASRACGFTFAAGVETIQDILKADVAFDGVFACSDVLAMGAVQALVGAGRRVPEDVAVIGYDDTPLAASFVPPLTSVQQDWRAGGALLARRILERIEGLDARSETLPTRLSIRAT